MVGIYISACHFVNRPWSHCEIPETMWEAAKCSLTLALTWRFVWSGAAVQLSAYWGMCVSVSCLKCTAGVGSGGGGLFGIKLICHNEYMKYQCLQSSSHVHPWFCNTPKTCTQIVYERFHYLICCTSGWTAVCDRLQNLQLAHLTLQVYNLRTYKWERAMSC